MSSTTLDEKVDSSTTEDTKWSNDGDHDKFSHYFSKKAIDNNLLYGTPMTAVCGKVVKTQVDPKGRTVCQTCKDIYEKLRD